MGSVTPIGEVDHGPDKPRLRFTEAQGQDAPQDPTLEQKVTVALTAVLQKIEQARQEAKAEIAAVAARKPSEELLGVFEALARALSLRVLLFVGFLAMAAGGAFVVWDPSPTRITAFCLFGAIAYLPIVWLNTRRP